MHRLTATTSVTSMAEVYSVEIRPAAVADAEALALLHVEVWEAAYRDLMPDQIFVDRRQTLTERAERWQANINGGSSARTMVATHADRLIGFASVGPARDTDIAIPDEIWALYVDAAYWGRGAGYALLTDAIGDRPAYLWVLKGNERATSFYRGHGFEFDGTIRTDAYGTELRMARPHQQA